MLQSKHYDIYIETIELEFDRMADQQTTQILYAFAPAGQTLKYVLADDKQLQTSEIMQLLLDRGVDITDLEYTAFSLAKKPIATLPGQNFGPPKLVPDVPSITDQKQSYPDTSPTLINFSVTLKEMIDDGESSYFMKWKNHGFVDLINNYVRPQMNNPDVHDRWFPDGVNNEDYRDIIDGNIRLSYGLMWVFEDRHDLEKDEKERDINVARKYGASRGSLKSLGASLGSSSTTLNYDLSQMFSTAIFVTQEKIDRYTCKLSVGGAQTSVYSFWSLTHVFQLEKRNKDGEWQALDGHSIVVYAKLKKIRLHDDFGGIAIPASAMTQMHYQEF